jgi:hypothetical protein
MSTKRVNIYTCNYRDAFIVIRNVHNRLHYMTRTVQNPDRSSQSVKTIADMVQWYVPYSTDDVRETPNGGIVLKHIQGTDWTHTKISWEALLWASQKLHFQTFSTSMAIWQK